MKKKELGELGLEMESEGTNSRKSLVTQGNKSHKKVKSR